MKQRPASGNEVFHFLRSKGFQVCEVDSSGRVVMSQDCDNSLWPDAIYLHVQAPYLPIYIEKLLQDAHIPPEEFWRD